jgi:PKD domain
MQKKACSQSGIFTLRILTAIALSVIGVSLAMASFGATSTKKTSATKQSGAKRTTTDLQPIHGPTAPVTPAAGPSPAGGTLSVANPKVTYTDPVGPVPNATGEGVTGAPVCAMNGVDCSNYVLTLDPSIFSATTGYDPTKANIVIQFSWSPSAFQYGSFVEDKNGNVIAQNTAGLEPETITIAVNTPNLQANGPYTIVTTLEIGSPGTGYTATVSLQQPTSGITQCNGCIPPRYQVYPATGGTATQSGEPSIGVDWNPNVASLKQISPGTAAHGPTKLNTGGITMFTATFDQDRVSFDDCSSPAINTWTNTAFIPQTLVTLDAIGFTDHFTSAQLGNATYTPGNPATPGRTFHGQLTAGDSNTSYTDDDGMTHTQSQGGGIPQGPDHETIGGGPYNPNSLPPPPPNAVYANAIYYCTQNVAPEAECSRSDDGGLTFGPGVPIYTPTQCTGSIHGHVKVARDGTVYVPNYSCTLPTGNQGVAVSTDNGLTWTENNVPGSGSPKPGLVDPSVGIGLNDVGKPGGQTTNTIYFGYIDSDGGAKIAVSHDRGATWSASQNVGTPFDLANTTFPTVVAGDDNRAAFGFLGTTTTGDSSLNANFPGVWHLYIATTYDGGNSWVTVDVTPNDPVQVGPVCNGGTTCSTKRNLLDFNGFDVDAEGRQLFGFADGCVNCTNSSSSADSNAALGTVARQSGGPRLFAFFDPPAVAAPAAPQLVSAVPQSAGAGVLVSWLEPDNGGAPITAYKIYRSDNTNGGSGHEVLVATVANSPTQTNTKYLDTAAITTPTVTDFFYHVTAVNSQGESGFCQEKDILGQTGGGTFGSGNACSAEFLNVQGQGSAPSADATTEEQIQDVNAGEPFINCTDHSITWVIKVNTLDPQKTGQVTPLFNTEWLAQFVVPANANTSGVPQTLFVSWDTETIATGAFNYGFIDNSPTGGGLYTSQCLEAPGQTCAATGTASTDGTITIKLSYGNGLTFSPSTGSPFTVNLGPGTQLSSIKGITFTCACAAGTGLLETDSTTTGDGSYAMKGNVPCAGEPPIAALSANPSTGNAPLSVTFDGSHSMEQPALSACYSINSLTMNFGDGSPSVTHDAAHPTFTHTYNSPGDYPARLTVMDTAGQTSTNMAQVVVTVNSAAAPQLNSVVSRMTHGTVGTFDINLPLTGPAGIECRRGGQNGSYTMIFTFAHNLVSVGSVGVTNGGPATIGTSGIGPNPNQYAVNVSNVPNAQVLQITLVNAKDTTNAIGNVTGTMDVLIGDTNADRFVDSADISQTKSQSGNAVNGTNFREDVNVDGFLDSADIALVKSKSGTALP